MTTEERELLRKQIDVRVRERLDGLSVRGGSAAERFGPSPPMPNEEFNEAAVLDDALAAGGFTLTMATDVVERFSFANAGQVQAWMQSHGGRLLLDRCDNQQLARFRELVGKNLEAYHRTADGDGYELVQPARMTVAQRA